MQEIIETDLGVIIGRNQPPHKPHVDNHVVVGKRALRAVSVQGSANKARSPKNPFTADERKTMLLGSLDSQIGNRFDFIAQDDLGDTPRWVASIREQVEAIADRHGLSRERITLFGHQKDASSFYLREFPFWNYVELPNTTGISATPFREAYFSIRSMAEAAEWFASVAGNIPEGTIAFLRGFLFTPDFHLITDQF